jgi:hypothetical protein
MLLCVHLQAGRSFFSEIIASTSGLRFSSCGRYMLKAGTTYFQPTSWLVNLSY